jgi:NhaA family Na+:H+ antiporter
MRARVRRPLQRFLAIQAASGIILLIAAAVAIAWANSPWAPLYRELLHTPLGIRVGSFAFERSVEWFVNDVLMVVFFFVVGLEIRREIHHGELSTLRRAALPLAAAVGGMVAPALLYVALAGTTGDVGRGWGVPTATDIAFAVGVLALLGDRVPPALRVLLLALAVIDDLGAILVIAIFYSSGVSLAALGLAALGVVGVLLLQKLGVRNRGAYLLPALVCWAGTYAAGVHPTIAGVIIGMLTPVVAWVDGREAQQALEAELRRLGDGEGVAALQAFDFVAREAQSPSAALIEQLHPWVAFVIMPTFALANAGVTLDGLALTDDTQLVALGVVVGLALGKPLGVVAVSALVTRLGVATLPVGIGTRQLVVLGVVAGIGFTMSLFIAQLAFARPELLGAAKLGVLAASVVAGVVGWALGRALLAPGLVRGAAATPEEAEASTTT